MSIDVAYIPIIGALIVGMWVGGVAVALFVLTQMKERR